MNRKTYVKMLHDVLQIKTPVEASIWLEREALNLSKKMSGTTLEGTKYLIKESLSSLLRHYPLDTEKKLAKLLGITRPLFGNFHVE